MGRPDVPRERDLRVQVKGELLSWERKRKRIYRVGGQKGRRNQEIDGGARGWADPEGSPYRLTDGGGLTCQENAERQKAKKIPTSQVSHRATTPGRGHLLSPRSGSLCAPPVRPWPL